MVTTNEMHASSRALHRHTHSLEYSFGGLDAGLRPRRELFDGDDFFVVETTKVRSR